MLRGFIVNYTCSSSELRTTAIQTQPTPPPTTCIYYILHRYGGWNLYEGPQGGTGGEKKAGFSDRATAGKRDMVYVS